MKMSVNRTLCSVSKMCTRNLCTTIVYSSPSAPIKILQNFFTPNVTKTRNITSSNNNNISNNTNNSNNRGLNNQIIVQSGKRSPYSRRNLAPTSHNYTTALSNMTKDQANDLVFRLNDQERQLLLQVLTQFQSTHDRKEFEVNPAAANNTEVATEYKPQFSVLMVMGNRRPPINPNNFEQTPKPSSNDLMKLTIINSLPFIGFGFLDNFTMIIAGDYIEHSIAGFITISTMAAAALGNTISDVLGIGSAYYVERGAEKVGIKPPQLTPIQLEMPSSRRSANIGRVLGITIGCILGMCPLMFMKSEQDSATKVDVTVSAMAEGSTENVKTT